MSDFIWPSDQDRADNDELQRVCERLGEVEDERDALAEAYDAVSGDHQHYRAEAEALAAHIEQLRQDTHQVCESARFTSRTASDGERYGVCNVSENKLRRLAATLRNGLETSLTRLKAEWQAEALEDAADRSHEPAEAASDMNKTGLWLRRMADDYRRQAQEQ